MTKNILTKAIIACLVIFSISANGQTRAPRKAPLKDKFEVTFGDELRERNTAVGYAGKLGEYTYVIKQAGKKWWIDKLDAEYNLIKNEEINLRDSDLRLAMEDIIVFGGKIFLFTTTLERRERMKYLIIQEIDPDDLTLIDEPKTIGELSYEEGSSRNSGSFNIKFSRDKELMLIFFEQPDDKDVNETIGFSVYNSKLEQVWKRTEELPYNSLLFNILDYEIDNDGKVYMAGKLYEERARDRRKGNVNYQVQLLTFTEEKTKEDEIKLNNIYFSDLSVFINEKELICTGFYSNDFARGANGIFVLSIDKTTGEIKHSGTQAFDRDFIMLNMTESEVKRTKRKEEKGDDLAMFNLDIKDIIYREDGTFIVVAEEYFVRVVTYRVGNSTQTEYHYYYNDIIVYAVGTDYQIQWYNKIPKIQHTVNDGGFYSSYYVRSTPDRLLFIFNDNIDNLRVVKSGRPKQFNGRKGKSIAVCVSMDYTGNTGKAKLFSVKNEEILLRPKACTKAPDNGILLFAQRGKTQRYGVVKLVGTR